RTLVGESGVVWCGIPLPNERSKCGSRAARNAFTITATSMASCSAAPIKGGSIPRAEGIIEHDDVGRFGTDARAVGGERDADIGLGERGRVVDAVSHHHHTAALRLEALDE